MQESGDRGQETKESPAILSADFRLLTTFKDKR